MSRTSCSHTIASAKKQIRHSRSAIANSKKRIYQGNMLVNKSKTTITNSRYRLILSVFFLTNYFLLTTLQDLANCLYLESIPVRHKNAGDRTCLTPQENLQQIMTHPFKTGLCPCCGHCFPKLKNCSTSWNCLACGWSDSLFS